MSNPNIRNLLRAELSHRRISHPHASYTTNKSNLLSCTVCHLVIRSEVLWDGHLRSANHRKNLQALQEKEREGRRGVNGTRKRKAEDLDEEDGEGDGDRDAQGRRDGSEEVQREMRTSTGRKRKAEEVDDDNDLQDNGKRVAYGGAEGMKKTKNLPGQSSSSRPLPGFIPASTDDPQSTPEPQNTTTPVEQRTGQQSVLDDASAQPDDQPAPSTAPVPPTQAPAAPAVDEDEWAAFEADIAPLAHAPNSSSAANATISAGPISASDLAAQIAADERQAKGRSREEEAEAEREDEGRRMEEEFEVQEEMEGRVRRLRDRLRAIKEGEGVGKEADTGKGEINNGGGRANGLERAEEEDEGEDDDDTDEFDEWGLR
jgi:zinc finger protein 830